MQFKSLALISLLISAPAAAYEVDLGVASEYNIFVQNDFTHVGGSDSQGKIAVGGNASIDSYDVGVNYNPHQQLQGVQFVSPGDEYQDVLVVQGDLKTSGTDNIKGNLVLGGKLTAHQYWPTEGFYEVDDPNSLVEGKDPVNGKVFDFNTHNPIDFDAAFSDLNKLSEDLADMSATGDLVQIGQSPQYTFTPNQQLIDETGVFIAKIDGNILKHATDFYENGLDADTPIIINVSGKEVDFDSVKYYGNLAQLYTGPLGFKDQQADHVSPKSII